MRSRLGLLMLGAVSFLGASATVGCTDYYEKYYLSLVGTTGGSGAGGMGGTGGTGTGGDDGGPPPGCIPSENDKAVADTCGVFVSPSGDDNNDGTEDKPVRTLTGALAKGATIYACAGAMPYSEALVLDKAVTLFGGLDCGTWLHDATKKTELKAGPDEVALTVTSSAGGSAVEDFAIAAADAMKPGGSSIAVIVDGVMASFTRTDITAGNGQDGEAGTTPTDSVGPTDPNDDAIKGNGGKNACSDAVKDDGGLPKENPSCPAASGGPLGGSGGDGFVTNGGNGQPGQTGALGASGMGEPVMGAWSCAGNGTGQGGDNGGPGAWGMGAQSADLGTIGSNGYMGVDGEPGGPGQPGQGGGGGGGAKGKTACAGASGGGGGAGGCGGHGGTGGKAGGASIGILSIGATLAFDVVTINTGNGGKGGDGAVGQGGGIGGKGGSGGLGESAAPATLAACDGGNGGQGGPGGQGGGGRGGHAVGIAYTGMDAPSTKGLTFANKGTPGDGGQGDNANGNMGDGAKGVAVDVQEF